MAKFNLLGFLLALACLCLAHFGSGGQAHDLLNLHALLIVLGGSLGATLMQTPVNTIKQALWALAPSVYSDSQRFPEQAEQIMRWATQVRKEGFLALDNQTSRSGDEFTDLGLQLLTDGVNHEQLHQLLDQRIDLEQDQAARQAEVFEAMGGYCPTMGILGAVLGLIQAMNFLNNPALLGQGIAVAFVATIYGVGFANFLFLPLANLLRHRAEHQALFQEMSLAGFSAIHRGASANEVRQQMNNYLKVMANETQA